MKVTACFTTTFFHHPDELRAEASEAAFIHAHVLAVGRVASGADR